MGSVQPNEISQLEEIQHVDAFITELGTFCFMYLFKSLENNFF